MLPDAGIIAVGRGNTGKKGERMQVTPHPVSVIVFADSLATKRPAAAQASATSNSARVAAGNGTTQQVRLERA